MSWLMVSCQLVHYLISFNATMTWHLAEADMCATASQCQEVHNFSSAPALPQIYKCCMAAMPNIPVSPFYIFTVFVLVDGSY